jgi:hypothetical protein
MKLITGYDKDARLILCVFARKHEKQNRQLHSEYRLRNYSLLTIN